MQENVDISVVLRVFLHTDRQTNVTIYAGKCGHFGHFQVFVTNRQTDKCDNNEFFMVTWEDTRDEIHYVAVRVQLMMGTVRLLMSDPNNSPATIAGLLAIIFAATDISRLLHTCIYKTLFKCNGNTCLFHMTYICLLFCSCGQDYSVE